MAVKTDIELAAAASIIQNETVAGENTADRVGQLLNDIIENKVNVDKLPKIYRALINQTTTGAPVATVLENTLSAAIIWTRSSAGSYIGTLSGAFTVNKTFIPVPSRLVSASGTDYSEFTLTRSDANSVSLTSTFGPNGTATYTDSMLVDYPVEILVYN